MRPTSLQDHLAGLQALRGEGRIEPAFAAHLMALKRWQNQRFAGTYADLAAHPRYAKAVRFFLDDLYGPKFFAKRDQELLRLYPTMVRLLPRHTVETVELAIELDWLSETLDQRVCRDLHAAATGNLGEAAYLAAFRATTTLAERLRQVELVAEVGRRLDQVVKIPLVNTTLRMLRGPSRLAGMGEMQEFLERGFGAFKHMQGAEVFLNAIDSRERSIMERIFSGHPAPFSPPY